MDKPEYERLAIHVLASQNSDGAITLGDSHEYGLDVNVFDRTAIDDLILAEARTFLKLPNGRSRNDGTACIPCIRGDRTSRLNRHRASAS